MSFCHRCGSTIKHASADKNILSGAVLALYLILSILAAMGAWVLVLCWHKSGRAVDRLRTASVLGLIALGTFFVATFAMGAYGGSLSDEVGEGLILGLNGNVVVFAIALVIQAGAAVIAWTQLGEDQQ